ncbi:MAG TPA: DUF177 domain-containing protein [Bacteroidales bacterium]|jgi:uncharacterized metal-binding protein YceD (DUF177 family)|nr:DUF177 domain-containing protein [Bacteroidales bacterium]
MNPLKEFIIPFVGLELGNHQFDFEVDDKFFEQFEYSQIHSARLKVTVLLEKQERMMIFNTEITGEVDAVCDRCGGSFMLPVDGSEQLIVKFGEEYSEESDDVVVIPATDYKFDLAPFIYEYSHLMLPARILHPDDENGNSTCDPDVLKRLSAMAPHDTVDPRWEALKNLQTDKEK